VDSKRVRRAAVRHHDAIRATTAAWSPTAAAVGSEDHVRELFSDRLEDVHTETRNLRLTYFATPEAFRDYFKINYGPTMPTYKFIADDPDRVAALDHDLAELGRRFDVGTDSTMVDWEYLIFTARKSD